MENFRLKVFRTVAHHLNFRRASEDLFISQPAVTQQIKALEDEVGLPLFDRAGGRVLLTPVGEILFTYAKKLKRIADEASQAIAEESGAHIGRLSLGASQTIGQYLLPNLMAGFLRENPRIELDAMSGNTDAVLEALTARTIDLALIEGPALRRDIAVEPFMEDHMVLVAPTGHEWTEHEITIATLATGPLLMREQGSGSRRVIEQALAKAGIRIKGLRIPMMLDSTEGLLSAVEAGLGTTFVSRWAVRNQLTLGTLKIVRVQNLQIPRMFSIAYPTGPAPTGNAGAFHRFVIQHSNSLTPRATGNPRKRRNPI
jgi:LysR family transcriptional regulator, transcriptional activator of the cysJI operon